MYSVAHLHVAQLGLEPCMHTIYVDIFAGILFREIVAP